MWIISGPFDGQEKNEIGFKKAKLLKTGSSYSLGRKERQLTVNHGKVSHDHGAFTVGPYSQEDVTDPLVVPNLSIHNTGKKAMTITRDTGAVYVNPSSTEELRDGDTVDIIGGVSLSIQWRQVCCLVQANRGKSSVSLDACASLGVSILYTTHPSVTHHLISQFLANPSITTSLLAAAQFVKPEWLNELIRLGNLPINDDPSNGRSLEQIFALPAETKFRPTFGAALPTSLKVFKAWEPNEERINMFIGYRFLFVGEKGREAEGAMTELVTRGGGNWAAFNVASGRKEWHHVLAKEKAKQAKISGKQKGLVIVADAKGMEMAVGSEQWEELVDEAESFDLNIVAPEIILQVVLHVDTALIASRTDVDMGKSDNRSSSPLADFVPNTHPGELSYPPPTEPATNRGPSRTLKRRVTPSAVSRPSTPPETLDKEDSAPPPRKPLKRRANAPLPSIIGIDDPSVIESAPDAPAAEVPIVAGSSAHPSAFTDITTPIPTRSSRLKRRAGTIASTLANTQAIQSQTTQQSGQEPPLKKFKALFDATHPDRHSVQDSQSGMNYSGGVLDSQFLPQSETQTQSVATSGGAMNMEGARLDVVAEEGEERGIIWTQDRGIKRKSRADDHEIEADAAGLDGSGDGASAQRTTKKRAVEDVNAVQLSSRNGATAVSRSKQASTVKRPVSKSGAALGTPDTDAAFLKAVASTKRGKKTEDEFDREFNKLKISKPDMHHEEQEKEWAVLDEFEQDRGIRGNFMVVLEMDVYSRENGWGHMRDNAERLEWQGKPNFKKFKKKSTLTARTKVELVVHEENDYGMGYVYWKGNSQSQSQGPNAQLSQPHIQKQSSDHTQTNRPGRGRAFIVIDSDEDAASPTPRKNNTTAKPTDDQAARVTQNREKAQPLFLDSDKDNNSEPHAPNDDDDFRDRDLGGFNDDAMATLRTQESSARQTRSSKPNTQRGVKKTPVIVDDDSDDGATFKGFKGKRRGAR